MSEHQTALKELKSRFDSREQKCKGKVRYSTKAKARLVKRQLTARIREKEGSDISFDTYLCTYCCYYHVGKRSTLKFESN